MRGVQLALNLLTEAEPGVAESVELGEVFTRPWVVELILDLAGYDPGRDLAALRAIEPACGDGAFLGPMIDRLLQSARRHGRRPEDLAGALEAFDLSTLNAERTTKMVLKRLTDFGVAVSLAEALAGRWVRQGDFLMEAEDEAADFVIGNPPYIRLESVPPARMAAYRAACPTMRGRSDVYVGFIEMGLRRLKPGGALGFIVADRWMHNQYGAELRRFITQAFSVEAVVEMHDADAFEERVSAYPAITIVRRRPQADAVMAVADSRFSQAAAERLGAWATRGRTRTISRAGFAAARLDSWFQGDELWPSGDPEKLALVRDLERRFPPLECQASGTRVGIGVATGSDDVYLTRDRGAVEKSRLLPLITSADVAAGRTEWSGTYLVNPWDAGQLVDLEAYPRLSHYFRTNGQAIRVRHVARRQPDSWFRTIDRVDPALRRRPKLLLPDIKAASHPVLDEGNYYPHHNLYFVVSDIWDLEVLGGLLLSDVANLFVGAYCVKMRGGCYRFQAQYLRRIRVPDPGGISSRTEAALRRAFRGRDRSGATAAAVAAYGLDAANLARAMKGS